MNKQAILLIVFALLVLVSGAGILWLALAPMTPPVQHVVQALPDERIPH